MRDKLVHRGLCDALYLITGETFNKSGRTDILVRRQGSNVFVAECKIWHGLKTHHATIDQLLGYLTWRDSKAALVYLVGETRVGPILDVIAKGTPQHPCFIPLESARAESWMQYEFKLPTDPPEMSIWPSSPSTSPAARAGQNHWHRNRNFQSGSRRDSNRLQFIIRKAFGSTPRA